MPLITKVFSQKINKNLNSSVAHLQIFKTQNTLKHYIKRTIQEKK